MRVVVEGVIFTISSEILGESYFSGVGRTNRAGLCGVGATIFDVATHGVAYYEFVERPGELFKVSRCEPVS